MRVFFLVAMVLPISSSTFAQEDPNGLARTKFTPGCKKLVDDFLRDRLAQAGLEPAKDLVLTVDGPPDVDLPTQRIFIPTKYFLVRIPSALSLYPGEHPAEVATVTVDDRFDEPVYRLHLRDHVRSPLNWDRAKERLSILFGSYKNFLQFPQGEQFQSFTLQALEPFDDYDRVKVNFTVLANTGKSREHWAYLHLRDYDSYVEAELELRSCYRAGPFRSRQPFYFNCLDEQQKSHLKKSVSEKEPVNGVVIVAIVAGLLLLFLFSRSAEASKA